jgi:hypothetical protein
MSIFNLYAAVLADYGDFVRSFFTVADERAQAFVAGQRLLHIGEPAVEGADCYSCR